MYSLHKYKYNKYISYFDWCLAFTTALLNINHTHNNKTAFVTPVNPTKKQRTVLYIFVAYS